MPKVIKKRPAKKKPIQENEVKSAALEALDKIKERQKQVIIGVSIVIAVIVIYAAFTIYSSSMSSKAYTLEMDAYKYYYGEITDKSMPEVERWKKALDLYTKSVDAKVTPSALFYKGNCYYNLKDYNNALKEYSRFVDKFSGDNKILPLVYQKMASAYSRTNQKDKAFEALGKLAKIDNGLFKDTSLVLEARLYDETGEKGKAMEKYKDLVKGHPASPWSNEATSRIAAEEAKNKAGSAENISVAPSAGVTQPATPAPK